MTERNQRSRRQLDEPNEALIYLYSRLPFLIQRVSQILTAMFSTQAGPSSVTLPQFQLLDLLARDGESPQVDLARKAGIDAATAGLILGNLLRSGQVERRADPGDARRKIVAITEAGRAALATAIDSNRAVDRMIVERLGDDAWLLTRLLDRLLYRHSREETADAGLPDQIDGAAEGHDRAPGLALKLRSCLQISERKLADVVGPLGLTMRQYSVLFMLLEMPDLTKSDVVRLLGYEISNTTLIARILQEKGLIEAPDSAARRRYRITPAGADLLVTSHPLAAAAEHALSSVLGDAEKIQLQRLLGSVIQQFDSDMRQPIANFAVVKSHPNWPRPVLPEPDFLTQRRDELDDHAG